MQPPGSIVVVMLRRPTVKLGEVPQLYPPDGPWVLTSRDDFSEITATPEMEAMVEVRPTMR